MNNVNRSILTVAWLLVVWLALMESVTVGAVVAGLVVAVVIVLGFPEGARRSSRRTFRPWRALVFGGWFAVKLVEANVEVAIAVIDPKPERLRRVVIAAPVVSRSFTVRAILANALSLTPGTFIIEIDDKMSTYFVHFLDVESPDHGRIEVHRMERMVARAFDPSDETIAELDARIEQLEQLVARPARREEG